MCLPLTHVRHCRVITLFQYANYSARVGEHIERRYEAASTSLPFAPIRVMLAQPLTKRQPCAPHVYLVTARRRDAVDAPAGDSRLKARLERVLAQALAFCVAVSFIRAPAVPACGSADREALRSELLATQSTPSHLLGHRTAGLTPRPALRKGHRLGAPQMNAGATRPSPLAQHPGRASNPYRNQRGTPREG